jgi:ribosome-binding protein aMBF1 (putative translation factor)
MTCEKCKVLQSQLDRIREVLGEPVAARGRQPREFATEAGKLIAAAASAKGMKLSEVSRQIGRAPDYVARICRGDIVLGRPAAIVIGKVLGVELNEYVGVGLAPAPPVSEPLPFHSGPCAADRAREAS